jgi:hypothetical protein
MIKRSIVILAALLLTGCDDGDNDMPKPRQVCTQVTGVYGCGRGGTCEQCGNWQIGCPKPLTLIQTPTGQYDKGQPQLVCRLQEHHNGIDDKPAAPGEP